MSNYPLLLSGDVDSDEFEDSILWHMAEIANAFHDHSPNYSEYFSPTPYRGYNIIREIANERAIYCGFNKVCILRSVTDVDAFQSGRFAKQNESGRFAKQNGRPETQKFLLTLSV